MSQAERARHPFLTATVILKMLQAVLFFCRSLKIKNVCHYFQISYHCIAVTTILNSMKNMNCNRNAKSEYLTHPDFNFSISITPTFSNEKGIQNYSMVLDERSVVPNL